MCLIIVADSARPSADELKDAELCNNDGMGIAYQEEGNSLVQYQKGVSLTELTTLTEQVKLPFILHFRMATHGGVNPALCHPFPITRNVGVRTNGEARELLFHNGVWNDCVKFSESAQLRGPVSDTRIMAYLLHREGEEQREGIANQIAQQAGKLATFSDQTIERYGRGWITGGQTEETTKGCYYSNDNHLFSYGTCYQGSWRGYDYSHLPYTPHKSWTPAAKQVQQPAPKKAKGRGWWWSRPVETEADPIEPEKINDPIYLGHCACCDEDLYKGEEADFLMESELVCQDCWDAALVERYPVSTSVLD